MPHLSRPSAGPLPWRRAIIARVRQLEPRRVLLRLAIGVTVLAALDVGLEWRSTIDALGTRITVATVQRDVPAGSVLGPADVALVRWPLALVPATAHRDLPIGATVRQDLVAGEVLVEQRLYPDASGLVANERLVTIPSTTIPPSLRAGTGVELYGIVALSDGATTGSTRLATGTVVERSEQSVVVAVADTAVPVVLDHVALGVVDIVVRP